MRHKIFLLTLLLAACGVPHLTPYKMDVRQGNFVTQEMRDKLKLGMSKQQVRYVLGTPLVSDAFHGNRWDYAYSLAQQGAVVERQSMTLYFEGDNLTRIDDAAMPVSIPVPVVELMPVSAVAETASVSDAPVEQPAAVTTVEDTVRASVQAWAGAWSARDSKGYLAAYAPSYQPVGMSRSAWEKQRVQRIGKAQNIKVELSDVTVRAIDATHATASFKQDYRSGAYLDSGKKILQLEKSGDKWLIVSEQTEK